MSLRYLITLVILIYNFLIVFSQEKVLEFSTSPNNSSTMKNSFSLVNSKNASFTVFLSRKTDLEAYHFNDNMELQERITSTLLTNKYSTPIGGRIDEKVYTLYFSNKKKTKFASINFDFERKISKTYDIDLKLKKEKFLAHFNYKDQFYLITTTHHNDYLNLYILNSTGSFEKKIIDLSEYELYGRADYPAPVYQAFSTNIPSKPIYNTFWVQKDVPYSLDSMTSLYKLYITGDSLQITSDINPNFTQIITYDLITEDIEVRKLNQPKFKNKNTLSNSFLLDNILYQFRINPKEMALSISNYETNEILKEHRIKKKEDFYLSSGPIRQRGGHYKRYRELEKTAQFLRKVGNGNPSIYVDKIGSTQKIVLGSVDEVDVSALQALTFANPFTAVASIGSVTLFFNPVSVALLKSSNTKAVYITGYLDQNFQTTQAIEKDDIFYRVKDYLKEEKTKRYTAVDIFQYKDYFLFGMLDKKTKIYSLRKFEK